MNVGARPSARSMLADVRLPESGRDTVARWGALLRDFLENFFRDRMDLASIRFDNEVRYLTI